jgi:hypothetical protein
MNVCDKCGKDVTVATYSGGKYYCKECYQEIRNLKQLASS